MLEKLIEVSNTCGDLARATKENERKEKLKNILLTKEGDTCTSDILIEIASVDKESKRDIQEEESGRQPSKEGKEVKLVFENMDKDVVKEKDKEEITESGQHNRVSCDEVFRWTMAKFVDLELRWHVLRGKVPAKIWSKRIDREFFSSTQ